MENIATIGELARAAAIPVSTIRFWERKGLLRPDGRTGANYRWYGPEALRRVRFIRSAQSVGFTLGDVRALLELRDGHAARCEEVRDLLERRLAEIERRVEELQGLHETLDLLVRTCRGTSPASPCPVLGDLDRAS